MSLRHLLTMAALAALTLATASAQAQTTPQNGGRLRALIAQKQAAAAPAVLSAGVQRIADVPYGVDPAQRMDVYVPTSPATGTNSLVASAVRAPVIFMVHGGGWRHGDKAMGRVVQEKVNRWVPKGFILISINYRMLPDAPWPSRSVMCRPPSWPRSSACPPGVETRTASSSWATRPVPTSWPCSTPARHRPCAKAPGLGWAPCRSTAP